MSTGLLFSQMEPPAGWEADFHDWYDTEHVPARMRIPGFAEATRYEAIEGEPRYLACYFIDDMGTLESPAYAALKSNPGERSERMLANVLGFTRYICDLLTDTGASDEQPGALSVVAFNVPSQDVDEFEDWYQGEHVPLLMKVPGWLRVRRYAVRPGCQGPAWTHLALHELRGAETLRRPERALARKTARRDALSSRPWFGGSGRWVYRPIAHAVGSPAAPRAASEG